jgi:uncharacterized protein
MMRWLLLLAVVVGVILWWKHSQRGRRRTPPAPSSAAPEAMLRCAECGLHLPASQSLPGRGGVFCSSAHRQAFELRTGTDA